MFLGEVPGEFYVELLLRAVFIYLLLLVSMRLMGHRMAAQLNRNEMAALVSLAAAIGVPILDAQRGLLPIVIIAAVVVVGQRLIARRVATDETFEAQTQDKLHALVEDGVIHWQNLKKTTLSREQLMAQLRKSAVVHLGEVRRLYMEANGAFTLVRQEPPLPGLVVLPAWDRAFIDQRTQPASGAVCHHCGTRKTHGASQPEECPGCGRQEWVPGRLTKQPSPQTA